MAKSSSSSSSSGGGCGCFTILLIGIVLWLVNYSGIYPVPAIITNIFLWVGGAGVAAGFLILLSVIIVLLVVAVVWAVSSVRGNVKLKTSMSPQTQEKQPQEDWDDGQWPEHFK